MPQSWDIGADSFTSPSKEGTLRIIRTREKSDDFGRVRTRQLGYQRPETTETAEIAV